MSAPTIGIGHPVSAPPPGSRPRGPHVPLMCRPREAHVRPADPQPHGAVFGILHMPYGIRNSEIQNRESGIGESGIMVRSSRPIQAVLF